MLFIEKKNVFCRHLSGTHIKKSECQVAYVHNVALTFSADAATDDAAPEINKR